ncbi:TonB-dependent receptor [Sphingomicrobium nitratireducens]|uniref:TonB-dependent receptor n=1 Tax=Sphingomicrobium nitratireducens TaxID=2964666 RepID=UPI00223EB217|nr:TonB-dependent receptor [Sphingomicrobium nitratireducens]
MRKSVWMMSAGLMALSVPAYAQETDTDGSGAEATQGATAEAAAVSDDAVETDEYQDTSEIVVTATRRNAALSDVPLAVSAVTAESLQNAGANDIRDLTQVSPSLLVSSTSSEAGAGVARIRGVGTVGDNPGLESSVAVFIDGVYRSRTGVGLTELGPVDRIEVLRGPQGTLFGRNASAGLISVITAKPRFDAQASGSLTYGNFDYRRGELSVTGPLSDTVAGRIDGVYMKRDGFLTDTISGRDINDRDRWLLRGQVLFEPSSDVSFRLVADYAKRDEECCGATYLPAQDYISGIGSAPSTFKYLLEGMGANINDDTFVRETEITPGRSYRSDVEDYGLSGELVYDFGGAELTSITAYRVNDYVRGQDADFNSLDILYRDDDGGAFNKFKTFSQELRLQGEAMGGKLDWLVGGYFARENLTVSDNLTIGADFPKWANCLTALNFVSAGVPSAIIAPDSPTCFNSAVASQVRSTGANILVDPPATWGLVEQLNYLLLTDPTNPAVTSLVTNIAAISAFARLGAIDLGIPGGQFPDFGAGPIFGNSGYVNLANAFTFDPMNPGAFVPFNYQPTVNDLWEQRSTNWALFTHNIFEVNDKIDITVGLRYTRERKTLDANLNDDANLCSFYSAALPSVQLLPCIVPATPGGNLTVSDKKTEGKLSGTAVVSFRPVDQLLTYASYSRGYKAGGFNLDRTPLNRSGLTGAILPTTDLEALKFAPETNNAFELGFKYNGRGLDVNVAAFHQTFKSFQLNQFNGIAFEVENINSCTKLDVDGGDKDADATTGNCDGNLRGGVISKGVEWEVFARPIRDVNLQFGGTYVDTKYRDNIVGATGEAVSPQLFQLPGRRISNSNQLTLTGSISYTPELGNSGLTGLLYFGGRHMSSLNTGSDLDVEKIQPSFEVFNARVGVRGPDDAWAVELWGNNVFDKDYIQVAFDAPLQGLNGSRATNTSRGVDEGLYPIANQLFGAFLGEPRTYGITLRGKF